MVIITGTGRSGTKTLARLLGGRHEYRVHYILDKYFLAADPHADLFDSMEKRLMAVLDLHQGIDPEDFIDSSNLYIHFIDAVYTLNPSARFILSVRNGKDFARSAFSRGWHCHTFFGSVPQRNDPYYKKWSEMTPLERVAWIWTYRNSKALEGLAVVPREQKFILRIEDIGKQETLDGLESFSGLKIPDRSLAANRFNANPVLSLPSWQEWTEAMSREFDAIAGEMMKFFGYS
ncbi:MAG: hypothetical protein P8013_12520 [Candidatus Sulfobium sp.]|jgi:hypothetical protein